MTGADRPEVDAPAMTRPASAGVAFYRACADARAAGAAPLYRGQPGYRDALDRDGDGVACEPYLGR
ncbi:excalibur calcium-binding domain-containing protein [Sphingomonas colocasiae]|uniref:Excalibur calcium-binding domain-containing protein n=2 Tax=Sphingomonas colocasiae TaxID=1848973 RepID=A0ABS7PRJ1_9SPHN|nr:excalibur calcium-binding domain-containing protein [Sphingomonas colocasiae]